MRIYRQTQQMNLRSVWIDHSQGNIMRDWIMTIAIATVLIVTLPFAAHAAGGSAAQTASDKSQIKQLLDDWAKAFHDRDIKAIMSMYKPGPGLVAFDIVPPLQYVGFDAYKKDYETFLAQYKGPIYVEYRDVVVETGGTVAYAYGLERLKGTLVNGQKSDMWIRFTSGFRKINGHWLDVHDHISVPMDFNIGNALTTLKP